MASAPPANKISPNVPVMPASAKLSNFRAINDQHSDASDSDQSDASGRSLSPTRQGLSKTKKKKERRQFGAFADELGDLLGAAFQSKDEPTPNGLAASTHAAHLSKDGDLEMDTQTAPSGPKMSKRQRQNLAKMQARRIAKEHSKMIIPEQQTVAAQRKGMTIQEYRGQLPAGKKTGKSEGQKRRSRKERERLRKKNEQAGAMEID